jgi:hypothetical protein
MGIGKLIVRRIDSYDLMFDWVNDPSNKFLFVLNLILLSKIEIVSCSG